MNKYRAKKFREIGRGSLLLTLACAALALVLGLALRPAFVERTAEAENRTANQETLPPPEIVFSSSGDSPLDVQNLGGKLAQTVNDVEISVSNARLDGHEIKLDVCYDKPDSNNWLIRGATLQYDGKSVSDFNANPIEFRDPPVAGRQKVTTFENGNATERWEAASGEKGRRCDTLAFDVGSSSGGLNYTVTFNSIKMRPNEGAECEAYLTHVQGALNARNSGIQLNCAQKEWGAEVTITSKPDTLSQEEAEQIVFSNDFFAISGPWVFTGNIK